MAILDISDSTSVPNNAAKEKLSYKDSVLHLYTPKHWITWFDSTSYYQTDSISYIPSVFNNHSLKTSYHKPLINGVENRNWLFGLLLIITILYVYIHTNFHNRYSQVKRAFLAKRYYSLLIRDGNIFKERIVIPIMIIFLISFSLVIYCTFEYLFTVSQIFSSKTTLFVYVLIGVILYQLGKSFFIQVLGEIFYARNETEAYILDNLLFKSFVSLFLLPLLWLFIYSQFGLVLILIWVIIGVLTTIRLIKAVNNWLGVFSFFKLILYLCTLELLPIVILAKAMQIIIERYTI